MNQQNYEFWSQQKQAFAHAFLPIDGVIMKDFNRFCRWKSTIATPESNMMFVMEGRRQVAIRIYQHLELDAEALSILYPNLEAYYG